MVDSRSSSLVASLLLVAMPGFLVAMPGATSSFLFRALSEGAGPWPAALGGSARDGGCTGEPDGLFDDPIQVAWTELSQETIHFIQLSHFV